jgi:hypothetical protein
VRQIAAAVYIPTRQLQIAAAACSSTIVRQIAAATSLPAALPGRIPAHALQVLPQQYREVFAPQLLQRFQGLWLEHVEELRRQHFQALWWEHLLIIVDHSDLVVSLISLQHSMPISE